MQYELVLTQYGLLKTTFCYWHTNYVYLTTFAILCHLSNIGETLWKTFSEALYTVLSYRRYQNVTKDTRSNEAVDIQ